MKRTNIPKAYIEIFDLPFIKKSFGFEIQKSSSGRFQITNKKNIQHIQLFSINKVFREGEPTLISIIIFGWMFNFILVDFAFYDVDVKHIVAYQPGKGIHDGWEIRDKEKTYYLYDRNEVKKVAPYYRFHNE